MTSENVKQPSPKKKRGEMIAVCSAKGGVGRTVLTVNLAISLFKKNIGVSILDGDLQFGDIGLAMDLQSTFTIKDVMEEIAQLDEHTLISYLCKHDSGVRVLPAPDRPEFAELVTKEAIQKVIDLLLQEFSYLVVDTGVGLGEQTIELLEKADQILVVTNLEMATLKNTKLMLETLELLGIRDKVQIVINRSTMESVIGASDVPDILGIEDPIFIPNDFGVASQSLNVGIPFVINQGKTEIAKSIFKMAEQLTSRRDISYIKSKNPSVLSKLLSFKRTKEGTGE
ncbi:AAA family ATPase [Rossellomorea aquimaris]|uniref:AAA family ATPase n=1 Tax=Rossellomorea aquimaris TaxID=189382 RepID=UPI0007D08D9E|nr:AAA family ATPase [Rossellomorea aquimaris]